MNFTSKKQYKRAISTLGTEAAEGSCSTRRKDNPHYQRAVFCVSLALCVIKMTVIAIPISIGIVIICWGLTRIGIVNALLHPELSFLEQFLLLDFAAASKFAGATIAVFLALAGIEYIQYRHEEIEELCNEEIEKPNKYSEKE